MMSIIHGEMEDDWNLPLNFHLFAKYEKRKVYLNSTDHFVMECVESLTPIDMMSLSSGVHDATGFCVWTGSFLFIAALTRLEKYLSKKRVLELGCGTGIDGIALFKLKQPPSYLSLTDADPDALKLCEANMRNNGITENFETRTLFWGEDLLPSSLKESFDTVYGADILYDIEMLPKILVSVHQCLQKGGAFILSHVPRACYRSHHDENKPNLDEYIIQQSVQSGLTFVERILPTDLQDHDIPSDAINAKSLDEMQDIGATIFIFTLHESAS